MIHRDSLSWLQLISRNNSCSVFDGGCFLFCFLILDASWNQTPKSTFLFSGVVLAETMILDASWNQTPNCLQISVLNLMP
jgi:hypothetical protein